MSRGMGRVQREILAHLGTLERNEFGCYHGTTVWKLTKIVFRADEHEPTAAQLESVRRAVRSLTAAGRVESWRPEWVHHKQGARSYKQRVHYHLSFDYWGRPHDPKNTAVWERTVSLNERYVSLVPDPTPEEDAAWQAEKVRRDEKFAHLMAAIKAERSARAG